MAGAAEAVVRIAGSRYRYVREKNARKLLELAGIFDARVSAVLPASVWAVLQLAAYISRPK